MGTSELETGWDTHWDSSTEELRQTMLEVVRHDVNLRDGFINLLKQRFREHYDRAYSLRPLAVEHKTLELQQTHEASADELLSMVNSKMPLGNFVEQVACVPRSKAFSEPLGISSRSWCVFNHTKLLLRIWVSHLQYQRRNDYKEFIDFYSSDATTRLVKRDHDVIL